MAKTTSANAGKRARLHPWLMSGLVVVALGLGACSSVRTVESDVQS